MNSEKYHLRVAEIYSPHHQSLGTGFLIRDNLILTCNHIFSQNKEKESESCEIRLLGDLMGLTEGKWPKREGTLVWYNDQYDLSLLKLDGEKPDFLGAENTNIGFKELVDSDTIEAKGWGFPNVAKQGEMSGVESLEGRLSFPTGMRNGELRLEVTSPIPKESILWQGISGTAVFVGDDLVEVVVKAEDEQKSGYQNGQKILWVKPISLLKEDTTFKEHVGWTQTFNMQKIDDYYNVCKEVLYLQALRRPVTDQRYQRDVRVDIGLGRRLHQPFGSGAASRDSTFDHFDETYKNSEDFFKTLKEIRQDEDGKYKVVAIIGKAGSGKTHQLHTIAEQLLEQKAGLPIIIKCEDLEEGETLGNHLLDKWLKKAKGVMHLSDENVTLEMRNDLRRQFQENNVWLLLDSVENMRNLSLEQALEKLNTDRQDEAWLAKARIILTCRINAWDEVSFNPLKELAVYQMLPLENGSIRNFIDQWFLQAEENVKEETKSKFQNHKAQLENSITARGLSNEQTHELLRNPLCLALMCKIMCVGQEKGIPKTRSILYKNYMEAILKWNRTNLEKHDKMKLVRIISKLAFDGLKSEGRFRIPTELVNNQDPEKIFELACELNFLIPSDIDSESIEQTYAFFHPTFQEYFAAIFLKEKITSWSESEIPAELDDISSQIDDDRWDGVILFVAELLSECDKAKFLRFIHQKVNELLAECSEGKKLLEIVNSFLNKEVSVSAEKPAIRAFLFSISLGLDFDLALDPVFNLSLTSIFNIKNELRSIFLEKLKEISHTLTLPVQIIEYIPINQIIEYIPINQEIRNIIQLLFNDEIGDRQLMLSLTKLTDEAREELLKFIGNISKSNLKIIESLLVLSHKLKDETSDRTLTRQLAQLLQFLRIIVISRTSNNFGDTSKYAVKYAEYLAEAIISNSDLGYAIDVQIEILPSVAKKLLPVDPNTRNPYEIARSTQNELRKLKDLLINKCPSKEALKEWWNTRQGNQTEGELWTQKLQEAIGSDRFGLIINYSDEDRKRLNRYYEANKLLAECLRNTEDPTTSSLRERLLLPVSTPTGLWLAEKAVNA